MANENEIEKSQVDCTTYIHSSLPSDWAVIKPKAAQQLLWL